MEPKGEGCDTGTECYKKSNARVPRVRPDLCEILSLFRRAEKEMAKGDASEG